MQRPSPLLALAVPVAALLVVLFWALPNQPQAGNVPMPAAKFASVSFAPYRAWQSPLRKEFPTAAEVAADLRLVATRARGIRTYSALEGDYDIAALARADHLKVWLGIWLGSNARQNAAEMARGAALARAHPHTVTRVIVGNEVLLRRDLPVSTLIADIEAVKAQVRQPVTYADVWEFWEQFPQVAKHVDIVTVHILPYWENHPTDLAGAIAHIRAVLAKMHARFPGKPIAIGETGWPSRGRWRDNAAPSRVNEAIFIRRFIALARQEHIDYNLIEAFDQVWKYHSEGTVGANWGLWTAGRRPKFPLSGPVVENPAWPLLAGAACAGGLALLGFALAGRTPLAPRGQVVLAALAFALASALAFAWHGTVPIVYDRALLVAAIGNLSGQALLALLLLRRVRALLAGDPLAPARRGREAAESVRALLRLRWRRLGRGWMFDDLGFLFAWTAALLQLLLVFDGRYRDFPLPVFAVPLVATLARAALADWPRGGGGWEEALVGLALAGGAVASAVIEGPLNQQALVWNAAALILAAPVLFRLCPRRAR